MAAALVVIHRVNKPVLPAAGRQTFMQIEEVIARHGGQHLGAECCLRVETKAAVETAEVVVLVYKPPGRGEKSNKGIFGAEVVLHTQHTHQSVLVEQAGELGLRLLYARDLPLRRI